MMTALWLSQSLLRWLLLCSLGVGSVGPMADGQSSASLRPACFPLGREGQGQGLCLGLAEKETEKAQAVLMGCCRRPWSREGE